MFTKAGFAATFKYLPMFRDGLLCTVSLSALTVLFGFIIALILTAARLSNFRPIKKFNFNSLAFLSTCYVELFRATPMLVQLFIVYHVLLE